MGSIGPTKSAEIAIFVQGGSLKSPPLLVGLKEISKNLCNLHDNARVKERSSFLSHHYFNSDKKKAEDLCMHCDDTCVMTNVKKVIFYFCFVNDDDSQFFKEN